MKCGICIVFVLFGIMGAHTTIQELRSYSDDIYPYPEGCKKSLDKFADSASEFTKCSIKNARPITLCESCVVQYIQFDQQYQELMNKVANGTSCKSVFISHDRLDAVLEFHDNIAAVWNKGNCASCFDWSNSTVQLSNSSKHFIVLFNKTTNCIRDNNKGNNSEEVCTKCMQPYLQLDDYYKTMSEDSIGVDSICMDIVDSMNATRSIWSKTFNCCRLRRTPEIIFLCCSGIISSLPILYYLAVRFCGPIRDLPNVLRQSRFKQSLLRSVDGTIN